MADTAQMQIWLAEAEAARQRLAIGDQPESVQQGDMRVTYTRAEIPQLDAYIANLKAQIVAAGGVSTGLPRRGLVVDL